MLLFLLASVLASNLNTHDLSSGLKSFNQRKYAKSEYSTNPNIQIVEETADDNIISVGSETTITFRENEFSIGEKVVTAKAGEETPIIINLTENEGEIYHINCTCETTLPKDLKLTFQGVNGTENINISFEEASSWSSIENILNLSIFVNSTEHIYFNSFEKKISITVRSMQNQIINRIPSTYNKDDGGDNKTINKMNLCVYGDSCSYSLTEADDEYYLTPLNEEEMTHYLSYIQDTFEYVQLYYTNTMEFDFNILPYKLINELRILSSTSSTNSITFKTEPPAIKKWYISKINLKVPDNIEKINLEEVFIRNTPGALSPKSKFHLNIGRSHAKTNEQTTAFDNVDVELQIFEINPNLADSEGFYIEISKTTINLKYGTRYNFYGTVATIPKKKWYIEIKSITPSETKNIIHLTCKSPNTAINLRSVLQNEQPIHIQYQGWKDQLENDINTDWMQDDPEAYYTALYSSFIFNFSSHQSNDFKITRDELDLYKIRHYNLEEDSLFYWSPINPNDRFMFCLSSNSCYEHSYNGQDVLSFSISNQDDLYSKIKEITKLTSINYFILSLTNDFTINLKNSLTSSSLEFVAFVNSKIKSKSETSNPNVQIEGFPSKSSISWEITGCTIKIPEDISGSSYSINELTLREGAKIDGSIKISSLFVSLSEINLLLPMETTNLYASVENPYQKITALYDGYKYGDTILQLSNISAENVIFNLIHEFSPVNITLALDLSRPPNPIKYQNHKSNLNLENTGNDVAKEIRLSSNKGIVNILFDDSWKDNKLSSYTVWIHDYIEYFSYDNSSLPQNVNIDFCCSVENITESESQTLDLPSQEIDSPSHAPKTPSIETIAPTVETVAPTVETVAPTVEQSYVEIKSDSKVFEIGKDSIVGDKGTIPIDQETFILFTENEIEVKGTESSKNNVYFVPVETGKKIIVNKEASKTKIGVKSDNEPTIEIQTSENLLTILNDANKGKVSIALSGTITETVETIKLNEVDIEKGDLTLSVPQSIKTMGLQVANLKQQSSLAVVKLPKSSLKLLEEEATTENARLDINHINVDRSSHVAISNLDLRENLIIRNLSTLILNGKTTLNKKSSLTFVIDEEVPQAFKESMMTLDDNEIFDSVPEKIEVLHSFFSENETQNTEISLISGKQFESCESLRKLITVGEPTCSKKDDRTHLIVTFGSKSSNGDSSLGPGAIAGIVIGIIAALAIIIGVTIYCKKKRNWNKHINSFESNNRFEMDSSDDI